MVRWRAISTEAGFRARSATASARRRLALLAALLPVAASAQSFPEGCWLPDPGPEVPALILRLAEETAALGGTEGPCAKGEDLWTCTLPCGSLDLVRRNDVTLDLAASACAPALRLHSRAPEACPP